MKLGKKKLALESMNLASEALLKARKLPPKKKCAAEKDIKAVVREISGMPEAEEEEVAELNTFEGQNDALPGASPKLRLQESVTQGRYVVTSSEVEPGEVLFNEDPYCSVLLPECYSSHCHQCHQSMWDPVPCLECTQARYCSEECRESSWTAYHKVECGGLDLLHSVGVAHLALRILLTCGIDQLKALKSGSKKSDEDSKVLSLVEHSKESSTEDLFQYALTAALLTSYLEHRTSFFGKEEGELASFAATLILKHILQLVCNASAIYRVSSTHEDEENGVYSESQQRIATAIYTSCSMMNHSCDPEIIVSFVEGRNLVARALRGLKEGQEVRNCYGPHFRRHK